MPVIKSTPAPPGGLHPAAYNFDDLSLQANTYLEKVRQQGREIIQQAQREAAATRHRHENEARAAAEQSVQRRVEQLAQEYANQHVQTLMPALEHAVAGMQQARQEWLSHWEKEVVRLAAALAARIVRRELREAPEISLGLIQEALELAAGQSRLRIRLNPVDYHALGTAARELLAQHAAHVSAELLSDPQVSLGGCLVETEHGRIDQQIESQLARMEQELMDG